MAPTNNLLSGPLPDIDVNNADPIALADAARFARFYVDLPRAPFSHVVARCEIDARKDIDRMMRVAVALDDQRGIDLARSLYRSLTVNAVIFGDAEGCLACSDEALEWIDLFGPDDVDWRSL